VNDAVAIPSYWTLEAHPGLIDEIGTVKSGSQKSALKRLEEMRASPCPARIADLLIESGYQLLRIVMLQLFSEAIVVVFHFIPLKAKKPR
jgi:hypothetical protein